MKWRDKSGDWKHRFALLPIIVDGEYHWLVWYWKRFMCLYDEVSLEKERPADDAALAQQDKRGGA